MKLIKKFFVAQVKIFFITWISWNSFLSFKLKRGCPSSAYSLCNVYCQADWDDIHSYLRDVLWHNIFQLSTSTTTTTIEYNEWLQVGIDASIPHQKNQVVAHSSLWTLNACAGAIAHRSHLFHLYSQNEYSQTCLCY